MRDIGLLAFKWGDVQAQILLIEINAWGITIIVIPFGVLAIFTNSYGRGSCWQTIRVGPIFNMHFGVCEVLS